MIKDTIPNELSALLISSSDEEMAHNKNSLHSILAKGKEMEKDLLLNPRQYQSQLFEKAKTQNVIACLGTGSGKTLISVLLLKHMFNLEVVLQQTNANHNGGRRRMSLFLVNKIPLVRQQAQVIMNNTFLRVAEVFGDNLKNEDLLSKQAWEERFRKDKYDVIVATAQVILDALVHAFIRIEEINLIVFDEAHHAHKQDSYARIMNHHYYATSVQNRPKIFGMTASPLKAVRDFHQAVAELETTLDAKIFTARSALAKEIESIVGLPEEHIIKYQQAGNMGQGKLTQLIKEKCRDLEEVDKHLNRMSFNDVEYGPLMSDLAWLGHTDEMKGRVQRKLEQAGALDEDSNLVSTEWIRLNGLERMRLNTSDEIELTKRTKYVKDAEVNSAINEVISTYPPVPDIITVDSSNATSKILKLIEVLEACGSSPILQDIFCCIMFVKRQQTAIALCELLKRIPSLQGWLRPEWITGHNHDHGQGMDLNRQADTLRRFGRSDSTNLLIATTVLEEGLDISHCNYVIRFDLFDHHVSYLQSKGRARHKNSLFIVLVEEDNTQHLDLISNVNKVDQEIKACWKDLPEDQGAIACLDSSSGSDSDNGDTPPDFKHYSITSSSTGACLRPLDCVSIVCRYVGSLARDQFSLQKPEFYYKKGLLCGYEVELRFPANAKIRTVVGPWGSSRKEAARMASFEACKQLFELGELGEHLLPRKVKKTPLFKTVSHKKDALNICFHNVRRRNAAVYKDGIPRIEDIAGPLILHGIIIETSTAIVDNTSRPILVLLPSATAALPAVELFMDILRVIPATNDSIEVHLEQDHARLACRYSYQMMCLMGRQEWKVDRLPYLILPLIRHYQNEPVGASMIDWEEVGRPLGPIAVPFVDYQSNLNETKMQDLLLCEGRHIFMERLCEVVAIREDMGPYSLRKHREQKTGEEEETHLAAYIRKRKVQYELEVSADQPLIEALTIPRMGNRLNSHNKDSHLPKQVFLIPSLTRIVHCSASFLRSCLLLPSIMERYDQVFLARELNSNLLGGCVDERHLVEALTLSRTGQSLNYERLEYDGDCYLKLLSTTWAFSKCDSHREGDLNGESKSVLCNAALLEITLKKKIAEYATGQRLTRKSWVPPLLQSSKENIDEEAPTMSNKTMSDLVESILGAAWASSSDPMDLSKPSECATRLEIVGPGVKADLNSFRDIFESQVKPKEEEGDWKQRVEVGTLFRLQEELGYNFKSPHLPLEAVTHSSMLASGLPSYERLEFLGDAVLDLLVVSLFKIKFPHLDAGGATLIKGNAICNASLAVLCINLGLYRFLMHSHKIMAESIVTFRDDLNIAKQQAIESAAVSGADIAPYWHDLKPPKVLADLVEAMLGAVYVDSGFDIKTTKAFFDRMYKSHFDGYFQPETSLVRSPYDFIRLIMSLECTEWDIEMVMQNEQEEGGGHPVQCSLLFHGLVISRQTNRPNRGKVILRSKEDLDQYRNQNKKLDVSMDGINGRGLKSILQTCFPGNIIRDSEKIFNEHGDEVNLKTQNQYTNLHDLCRCKQRHHQEVDKEDETV